MIHYPIAVFTKYTLQRLAFGEWRYLQSGLAMISYNHRFARFFFTSRNTESILAFNLDFETIMTIN